MKRIITILILFAIMVSASGCLTPNVIEGNKKRIAIRKAIRANNEAAIQAIKQGQDIESVGIRVTTMEAITERKLLLAGAVVGDGLIIWGGVEGVQWLAGDGDGDRSSSQTETDSGRDSNVFSIEGDGNTINTRGDETVISGE